jgi:large subunit ribosomal protein L13
MTTFIPKIDPNNRRWVVIDLQDAILGRAAVRVADILRGKSKPIFTPHLDTGDHVVVVNASGLKVTGNKPSQKRYYRYTGYPGGLRSRSLTEQMIKKPEDVFVKAVRGMLPKNRLGRKMIKKLHVYSGAEHPHQAQRPEALELR